MTLHRYILLSMVVLFLPGCLLVAPAPGTVRMVDQEYVQVQIPHTELSMRFFRGRPLRGQMNYAPPVVWSYNSAIAWEYVGFGAGYRLRAKVFLEVCEMTFEELMDRRGNCTVEGGMSSTEVEPGRPFRQELAIGSDFPMRVLTNSIVVVINPSRLFIAEFWMYCGRDGQLPPKAIREYIDSVSKEILFSITKTPAHRENGSRMLKSQK